MKNIVTLSLILLLILINVNYSTGQSLEIDDKKRKFELSFGQNILFISDSKVIDFKEDNALVVPTSSVLLLAQLRPDHKWRVPVFFNLPIETKQFIVNGQLVSEKASPALGTGIEYCFLEIDIDKVSKIELEGGPFVSFLFDENKKVRVAPMIAARVRLQQGEHLLMYVGVDYALGVNAYGLFFGTGTIF